MTTEPIQLDSVVCCSSAPVSTEVNDEIILMNLERDRCYGLGSSGSEIWRRLRNPIRVSELVTQLNEMYEAEPHRIESDVLHTLREFAAEGLIEIREN